MSETLTFGDGPATLFPDAIDEERRFWNDSFASYNLHYGTVEQAARHADGCLRERRKRFPRPVAHPYRDSSYRGPK